ncbi:hypothetical protein C5167_021472 [Papaver somniferum]|nr:hypothetical protein C5167_021472 [Papaver somniferum]
MLQAKGINVPNNLEWIVGIGIPATPSFFGLLLFEELQEKGCCTCKLLMDDHYDFMIEEIFDPSAML